MQRNYSVFLFCFALFGLQREVFGNIKIKEFTGTETAEYGSSVTLKCDSFVKNDTEVVVKWYYNEDIPVFSWIPNKNKPQAVGDFKWIIEVDESGNTIEKDGLHSTIRFKNVTFNMTGDYKCMVTGDNYEDRKSKPMVVYQPASSVELLSDYDKSGSLNCSAYELYPQPTITLVGVYVSGSNESVEIKEKKQEITGNQEDFYNVTKTFEFNPYELKENVEFICTVFIPHTNYNETRSVFFEGLGYGDDDETTTEYLDDYYHLDIGNFTLLSNDTDTSFNDMSLYDNDTISSSFYNDTTTDTTTTTSATVDTSSTEDSLIGGRATSWRNPLASLTFFALMMLISYLGWC